MKILNARVHGILDYVVVVLFALAPSLFGLAGLAATLSYILAGVHLLMTLVTDFPMGVAKLVPFTLHGLVEIIVSVALVALAFLLFDGVGRTFYLAAGVLIFVTWLITDYKATI